MKHYETVARIIGNAKHMNERQFNTNYRRYLNSNYKTLRDVYKRYSDAKERAFNRIKIDCDILKTDLRLLSGNSFSFTCATVITCCYMRYFVVWTRENIYYYTLY